MSYILHMSIGSVILLSEILVGEILVGASVVIRVFVVQIYSRFCKLDHFINVTIIFLYFEKI